MDKSGIFNPLTHDFTCEWLDDSNNPHILTAYSKEVSMFPANQIEFVKRHLADEIINVRGVKVNHEADYKKILQEISKISL